MFEAQETNVQKDLHLRDTTGGPVLMQSWEHDLILLEPALSGFKSKVKRFSVFFTRVPDSKAVSDV